MSQNEIDQYNISNNKTKDENNTGKEENANEDESEPNIKDKANEEEEKKKSPDKDEDKSKTQEEEGEELNDPIDDIKNKCNQISKIAILFNTYQECNNRVNNRSRTTETCEQELADYLHELDHCVSKYLFKELK